MLEFKGEERRVSPIEKALWAILIVWGIVELVDGCSNAYGQVLPTRPEPVAVDTGAETVTFDLEGLRHISWCFDGIEIMYQDMLNCEANYDVASDAFEHCRSLREACASEASIARTRIAELSRALALKDAAHEKTKRKAKRLRWIYGTAALAGAVLGGLGMVALVVGSQGD